MKISHVCLIILAATTLAACETIAPTPRPDYVIRVSQTPLGSVATPPECADWTTQQSNPFDNQPMPQFGCATARNLANMIEDPNDLIEGRDLDNARGVTMVGAVRRYDNNQTRGLIIPGAESHQVAVTTAPNSSSSMSGDITASSATGGMPTAAP